MNTYRVTRNNGQEVDIKAEYIILDNGLRLMVSDEDMVAAFANFDSVAKVENKTEDNDRVYMTKLDCVDSNGMTVTDITNNPPQDYIKKGFRLHLSNGQIFTVQPDISGYVKGKWISQDD